jgi:hypothetical protein
MNIAHMWTGGGKIGSLFLQPSEVLVRPRSKALWTKSNREHAFDAITLQKRGFRTQLPDWVRDNGNGKIRIIKGRQVRKLSTPDIATRIVQEPPESKVLKQITALCRFCQCGM